MGTSSPKQLAARVRPAHPTLHPLALVIPWDRLLSTFSSLTPRLADINECSAAESLCGTDYFCVNLPGSHECKGALPAQYPSQRPRDEDSLETWERRRDAPWCRVCPPLTVL